MSGDVEKINLEDVEKIELPNASWSRMVLNKDTLEGNKTSLGYSIFTPGTELSAVSHECEELAIVISGKGELKLEDTVVSCNAGDALFIPPETWHAVINTGEEDLIMVFTFAYPDYPPTERK